MSGLKTLSPANAIVGTAAYNEALQSAKGKDVLAIFLDICEKEGLLQHWRRVVSVQLSYGTVDQAQIESDKSVAAKKESNKWLDTIAVVCMFACGLSGGQMSGAGMIFYAPSQACEKASQMYNSANQGKSAAADHAQNRFRSLTDAHTQDQQSGDKAYNDYLDLVRRSVEAYQRAWEQAAATA